MKTTSGFLLTKREAELFFALLVDESNSRHSYNGVGGWSARFTGSEVSKCLTHLREVLGGPEFPTDQERKAVKDDWYVEV